ncbi:MAG: DUF2071 domain-containing protein [Planctomycetota bacterium]
MKRHLTGTLEHATLIGFQTPATGVAHLLPAGLRLVQADGMAIWNLAVGHVRRARPRGLPACLGLSYTQVAYRLLVEADIADGTTRRGLYFVRSDTDRHAAVWTGNLMTDFRLHHSEVQTRHTDKRVEVAVQSDDLAGHLRLQLNADTAVDEDTPTAAPAVRCEELGLAVHGHQLHTVTAARVGSDWTPAPFRVSNFRIGLFDALGLDAQPTDAIRVPRVRYRWTLGGREPLLERDQALLSRPSFA